MKAYWIKTRWLIRKVFPRFLWRIRSSDTVYLTFDDGPTPEVTPWVLDQLKKYGAKATFFCIGQRIHQSPELLRRVIDEGHSIGNHTYNHLNAWNVNSNEYLQNVEQCDNAIAEFIPRTRLFRPPYGKIRHRQIGYLRRKGYKICMWDVLSADFDLDVSPEQCAKNVTDNIEPGSIVIFHDSVKANPNLRAALPATLELIAKKGWKCAVLPQD